MKRRLIDRAVTLLLLAALFLCLVSKARADILTEAPVWYTTGFVPMCARIKVECQPYRDEPAVFHLTNRLYDAIDDVNRKVNRQIDYKTDHDHYGKAEYFTYPTDGYGDCEDFALEKRRRLIELGFPRRAMRLTVVDKPKDRKDDPKMELHMVLTVRTDRGDLVLDSNNKRITRLGDKDVGYEIDWIQSARDPMLFDHGPGWRSPNLIGKDQ